MSKIVLKKGEYEYAESDRLGKGSFGQVYKGRVTKSGEIVAIKIISLKMLSKYGDEIKKVISSEVSVMVKLSNRMKEKHCPFIVRIIDCFRTENNIYMVLEYCGEGDLEKMLSEKGKFEQQQALKIIYEVCQSLEFLAENGVTHRDLKPQNIFLKREVLNGQIQLVYKLGDFGFAAQKKTFSTTLGTYPYMAPELFEDAEYDSAVDVWALGVMAHQLAFGDIFFIGIDQWQIKKKVLTIDYRLTPEQQNEVSAEFYDFVSKCLIKSKDNRIKACELTAHPVFKKIKQKELEVPLALRTAQNLYFIKTIKQLCYKAIFLAEVAKSLIETGRRTIFASIYLSKKSICFSSLLHSKLSNQQCPFDCDKTAWTIFVGSKDFKDAQQFVSSVSNNLNSFFTNIYGQFSNLCAKYSAEDQQMIKSSITTNPREDINSQLYEGQILKWRKELGSNASTSILALECLLASKIDLITTYDFEKHIGERKQLTQDTLRKRIYQI